MNQFVFFQGLLSSLTYSIVNYGPEETDSEHLGKIQKYHETTGPYCPHSKLNFSYGVGTPNFPMLFMDMEAEVSRLIRLETTATPCQSLHKRHSSRFIERSWCMHIGRLFAPCVGPFSHVTGFSGCKRLHIALTESVFTGVWILRIEGIISFRIDLEFSTNLMVN